MLLAIALPAVLAAGVNSGLAAAARALFDVPSSFTPLRPAAVIILTMAGTAAGAAGWLTVRKYAHRPKATLTWLVPLVIILSFIPDLLLAVSATLPGTTAGSITALLVLHIAVVPVAIPAYLRFLPLPG